MRLSRLIRLPVYACALFLVPLLACAFVAPAGAETNTTDAWAVAQTTARVREIRSSPGSGSLGL